MNRKIKFRAWDKKKKEWAFGYKEYGGFSMFGELHVMGYLEIEKLNDYEIMQYTGLKDKNGKEIYEGDIFNCIYDFDGCKHKLEVAYSEKYARFYLKSHGECLQKGVVKDMWDMERKEILGNIYENPNLLKT